MAIIALASVTKLLPSKTEGSVIGYANGKKIYDSEVIGFLDDLYGVPENFDFNAIPKDQKMTLIKQLYAEQSLLKEAEKLNIVQNEEVAKKIRQATSKIIKESYLNNISQKAVTRENIEKSYPEYVNSIKGQTEVRAKHILVQTEQEASQIVKSLKTKRFEDIAKNKSMDTFSKENGGDLGYFTKGKMIKEFENQVFSMEVGNVTPPFKTQYGWHIVKLIDKREAVVPELDSIYEKLKRELSFKTINTHINSIKENIEIKLVDSNNEQPSN